ncbi:MAG: hypothetical protein OXJ90_19690 [Spirochaetaceae bacterium]|nr:hypothetical protein [Spirochaetaceae bacterium]
MKPIEPPAPSPQEQLTGTWRSVKSLDSGHTDFRLLTFTKSRWIYEFMREDKDGAREEHFHRQGGWTITDTHVTRIEYANNEEVSTTKEYSIVDGNLVLERWAGGGDPEVTHHTYSREPAITATDLHATWRFDFTVASATDTLELNADGTFRHIHDNPIVTLVWEGTYTLDLDQLFIFQEITSATTTAVDRPPPTLMAGHTARLAFAPSMLRDTIRVSLNVYEKDYDPETRTFADTSERNPYGYYIALFTKIK